MRALLVLLLLLALPTSRAFAGDGILEISPACAAGPGCFAGDTAGYPVQITAFGSYRLTGDLVVPDQNTTAIEITAGQVTLDLAGHMIRRASCVPGSCARTAGVGYGILASGPGGTIVRNGEVLGMGLDGVFVSTLCSIEGIGVFSNGDDGIRGGSGCVISKCTASSNGNYGIAATTGATLIDNVAQFNVTAGIGAGVGTTIRGNTAQGNLGDGIAGADGNSVIGNTAYLNGQDGIDVGNGSTVTGNTAYQNGDATASTTDDGIECGFGCLVQGNSVRINAGVGLRLATDSGYRENVVTANTTDGVVGGTNLGDNHCAGTGVSAAACP